MSKHTPEPWHLFTNRHPETNGDQWGCIETERHPAGGCGTSVPGVRCHWTGELGRANAARIVACVNALANVPDPATFVKAARELADSIDGLEVGDFSRAGEALAAFREADARPGVTRKDCK